ncbi:MAG: hypothetical protein R2774_03670 [Saprospiraceae bacterium]
MKVVCKYNDPSNLPSTIPDNFDYGLELSKEYLVMGVLTFKKSNDLYFLVDENGRPSWFPHQIFEAVNNELPVNWFVKINIGDDYVDYQNLIGFDELCNKEDFFNQLLERDEEAMRIYFRRKIELEKELA